MLIWYWKINSEWQKGSKMIAIQRYYMVRKTKNINWWTIRSNLLGCLFTNEVYESVECFENIKFFSTPGPLHMVFPLLGPIPNHPLPTPYHTHTWSTHSAFKSQIKWHFRELWLFKIGSLVLTPVQILLFLHSTYL